MRIAGVVAEYDPFHLGHAYHLAETRRQTSADAVVVVMSTAFTQRGSAALLAPDDRVRMALQCGADAVVALPAQWVLRDAEHFALGGVSLLDALGCDCISFGAETAELPKLRALAALIEQPNEACRAAIRRGLDAGLSHPAALSAACEKALPGSGALLASPNNTLALCYLRALMRLGSAMTPYLIPRASDYHATALTQAFPSATAVRGAILRGDWQGMRTSLPAPAFTVLEEALAARRLHRPDVLDTVLLYRLRGMTGSEWAALPGMGEGLDDRMMKAARTAVSRETLLENAGTRRYPRARLSRMCSHALLGFTQADLDAVPLPPQAWLLGFREEARPLLAHLKQARIPLVTRAADIDREASWFRTECRAWDAWCLGAGLPAGLPFTRQIVRIPR